MKLSKYLPIPFLLTLLVLAAFLLTGKPTPVSAKRWIPPPSPSMLVVPAPRPYQLGEPLQVYAQLRDAKNNVQVDVAIDFYVDLVYVGQGRTDMNGIVSYQSRKYLPAGDHLLSVRFNGTKNLLPTSMVRKLTILPAVVTVQTLPPLAGVTYTMDNREFVSGPDGVAKITVFEVGRYTLGVEADKYSSPGTRIEFGRWEAESFLPEREVDVPVSGPIQAGMNVFHRIGQTFIDLDGSPVDMRRISKITIKSMQGDVFSTTNGDMQWVPASRIARRANGLEVTPLQYSVMNVTVDGSNVVNQAQQRFFVQPEEVWKIQLLLYSMRITTHDAAFGSPVGNQVNVLFPDGEVQSYSLDPTGSVQIHGLARGIYHIQVMGVKGIVSPTPVALSRNQEVMLQVITNQDLAVAGSLGLFIGVGLLLLGRPWLLLPALRRKRRAQQEELEPQAEGYASIHNN